MLHVMLQCVLLLAEDVDGDEDTDNVKETGWEVAKNPDQKLVVGDQIKVKVCCYLLLYMCYINLSL